MCILVGNTGAHAPRGAVQSQTCSFSSTATRLFSIHDRMWTMVTDADCDKVRTGFICRVCCFVCVKLVFSYMVFDWIKPYFEVHYREREWMD